MAKARLLPRAARPYFRCRPHPRRATVATLVPCVGLANGVIEVRGRLDRRTADLVVGAADVIRSGRGLDVTVDLTRVTVIDCAAVEGLLRYQLEQLAGGHELILVEPLLRAWKCSGCPIPLSQSPFQHARLSASTTGGHQYNVMAVVAPRSMLPR